MAQILLNHLRSDMGHLRETIAEVQSILRERSLAHEFKWARDQPRAPAGTTTGGQWTGSGSSPQASQSTPRKLPQPKVPQTLGGLPRPSLRTPLPIIVGSVAIQRAAGTFAAEVSGQEKTPFLHIPYSLPTMGPRPTASNSPFGCQRPRQSKNRRESGSIDRQLDA